MESVMDQYEESTPELKSRPLFSVLIKTNQGTLELQCSFVPDDELEEKISKPLLNIVCLT